jgi:hypothetical protein
MDGACTHSGFRLISRFVRARSWIATLAASFVTFYALDMVATGAGLLLVASGLLAGISHWQALALWAATNVVWGAGLWSMLLANWELLQRTGASTNILSKAAYDLAARLAVSRRWQCVAANLGYVSTELAKEAPYYVGAAGVALFSDSVTAVDALVFIVGTNIGASSGEGECGDRIRSAGSPCGKRPSAGRRYRSAMTDPSSAQSCRRPCRGDRSAAGTAWYWPRLSRPHGP